MIPRPKPEAPDAAAARAVELWSVDAAGVRLIDRMTGFGAAVLAVAVEPGVLVVGAADGRVHVFTPGNGAWEHTSLPETGAEAVLAVALSDGGHAIVAGWKSGEIQSWRRDPDGWVAAAARRTSQEIDGVAWRNDGTGVAAGIAGDSERVQVWNTEGGDWKPGPILDVPHEYLSVGVAFDRDGEGLGVTTGERIERWEPGWPRSWDRVATFDVDEQKRDFSRNRVAMSDNTFYGSYFVAGDDTELRSWWRVGSDWELDPVGREHPGRIESLVIDAAHDRVLTGGGDGNVRA